MDDRIGCDLFDGRTRLPAFVLLESALAHDIAVLADYCRTKDISFAPHGKTTMAPTIFRRQVEAGAWAITVADPWQAEVAVEAGIPRILIANEVVDEAGLAWLEDALVADGPEIFVLADSIAGVERMARRLAGQARRQAVLVEVGVAGGRAGVRTVEEALAVAEAVERADGLVLAGVSLYEGPVSGADRNERDAGIRRLTDTTREIVERLAPAFERSSRDEIIVSGGGSQSFDTVIDELAKPWSVGLPVRVVLRSGAYISHDHGFYERVSPFGLRAEPDDPRLRPAIEVWASVLSTPEPGLAIVGAGRRDLPYDIDMPMLIKVRGETGGIRDVAGGATVRKLNDQHAFVDLDDGVTLEVGDRVGFGISHPCSAFDRWRWAIVVDDDYRILDVYELRF